MTSLLLLLAACEGGPYGAPYNSSVQLLISDLSVEYFGEGFTEFDGVGAVFFNNASVLDPDGLPMNEISVELSSLYLGAYFIPAGAVTVVDELDAACADPGADGDDDIDEESNCSVFTDAEGQSFYEITGEYEFGGTDPAKRPNYVVGNTDERGVFPFYLFIDAADAGDSFTVGASIQVAAETMSVTIVESAGGE